MYYVYGLFILAVLGVMFFLGYKFAQRKRTTPTA